MQNKWIRQLKKWIKQLFGKKTSSSQNLIIERWQGKSCVIFQIARTTPGAIATYRINSQYGDWDYLITLDYLPELLKLRSRSNLYTHRFGVFQLWRNGKTFPIGVWDVDLEGNANFYLQKLAPLRAVRAMILSTRFLVHDPNLSCDWQFQIEQIDWLFLLERRIRGELLNDGHSLRAKSLVNIKNSLVV